MFTEDIEKHSYTVAIGYFQIGHLVFTSKAIKMITSKN